MTAEFWIGIAVGVASSWILSTLTVITLHALATRRDHAATTALDDDPLEQAWRLDPARKPAT